MAEARSVALVSLELKRGAELTVDDEGVHLRLHLTIPPARVMRSEIAKRAHRLRNFFLDTLFPIGPLALAVCMVVFMSVVLLADEQSWWRTGPLAAFVWQVSHLFPWYDGISRYHKLALITAWAVFVGFLLLVLLQRAALRALLSWRGWMYAPPGKRPLSVKLWGAAVTLLSGRHPLLYSFQSALPKLPLPALEATVKRYLRSLEPCMTDTEMAEMRSLADDFLRKEGPTLQRYLRLKHLMSDNYVHEWWEKYVYLRGRSPIMINSNYYCTDSYRVQPSTDQASRAAVLTRCCLEFKQQLDREELRPMLMQGIVPLCMDQYRRTFSTTRVPGRECDTLKHYDPSSSRHVAVLCRNHVYCFAVERVDHSMLEAWEIEDQMRAILEDAARVGPGIPVAALTAVDRTTWADARETHFGEGINKASMDLLERAALVVCLDEEAPATLNEQGHLLMHGNGSSRWFDKSIQIIVFSNGKAGFNGEHSWADAPVLGHLWEYACMTGEYEEGRYDAKGHCVRPSHASIQAGASPADVVDTADPNRPRAIPSGTASPARGGKKKGGPSGSAPPTPTAFERSARGLPRPQRLHWALDTEGTAVVEHALQEARKIIDDLDLAILPHSEFSKGVMKRLKVSPDAFIQIAMQLSYFRDQGQFTPTYESSMTRMYRKGRTETVRSCTPEAAAFVRAQVNEEGTPVERAALLRKAANAHSTLYKNAMSGAGVDRHLFALYVVSVGKDKDSPFLKKALSTPWRLSTSQQPQQYDTSRWNLKNVEDAKRISSGGGFGPVADNGYGVSYMVPVDDICFFHVTAKKSCAGTSADRFKQRIRTSMGELRAVLEAEAEAKQAHKGGKADSKKKQ